MDLPVIKIGYSSLAKGWETAVLRCYGEGIDVATEYDKPGDAKTKEVSLFLSIENPFSEPRIHKCMPGWIEDLATYTLEVLYGIHDHWINDAEGKWSYTYHQRIENQLQYIIDDLVRDKNTRRAQCTVWRPTEDCGHPHPACFMAGTKILTPYGQKNIENLKNGDDVFAYQLSDNNIVKDNIYNYFTTKRNCYKIKLLGGQEISVSEKQLIYTEREGWKKADCLLPGDLVKVSSSCSGCDISDYMMVGYMHGDGWLSGSINNSSKQRWDVFGSIHYKSCDKWLVDWLSVNSQNKINITEKYIKSTIAEGISKNIRVSSKELWNKLYKLGCPVGRKNKDAGPVFKRLYHMSEQEQIDFLIGIYSAEGSICIGKDNRVSIQLKMTWIECIDLITFILDNLGIKYSRQDKNSSIRIDTIQGIKKLVNLIDFRMDSRKQAQYMVLKAKIDESDVFLQNRLNVINKAKLDKQKGLKQRELMAKYKNFNSRWFKLDYSPCFRIKKTSAEAYGTYCLLPVKEVDRLGEQIVYDFSINHKDHAIVANNIVSHNCLQRLWFRIIDNKLIMSAHMRSNDAFKACFMNMFAFTEIQKYIAKEVSKKLGREIIVGQYNHIVDSFHIYGSYLPDFLKFMDTLKFRPFKDRTYETNDVIDIIEEVYNKYGYSYIEG